VSKLRTNILIIGVVVTAAGIVLLLSIPGAGYFVVPAGVVNIVLGVVTGKSFGVIIGEEKQNAPRVLVDRAVLRNGVYQLAFYDTKVTLKRLTSARATLFLAVGLFLVGLVLEGGGLIGGLSGGLTGYSLQEYTAQKRRTTIGKTNNAGKAGRLDLEFGYDQLEKVQVRRSSLLLFAPTGIVRVSLPRGYVNRVKPILESLLDEKYEEEPIPQPASS
jgi:hypothetical protein